MSEQADYAPFDLDTIKARWANRHSNDVTDKVQFLEHDAPALFAEIERRRSGLLRSRPDASRLRGTVDVLAAPGAEASS